MDYRDIAQVLEAMDEHAANDAEEASCLICYSSLSVPGRSLSCGHKFHELCLTELMRQGCPAMCPICLDVSDHEDLLFQHAIILKKRGAFEKAFRKLSEAVNADPNHVRALRSLAESFETGLGVAQNDELAAKYYEQALCVYRTDLGTLCRPWVNELADLAQMHLGAAEQYEQLGVSDDLRSKLGHVYKRLGRLPEAEQLFSEEYNDTKHPSAAFYLAMMCKENGNLERADDLYYEAHSKGVLVASLNLANLHFESERIALAEGLYRHVIHQAQLRTLLGSTSWSRGHCEASRMEHMDIVIKAMARLGMIYKQKGLRNEARKMWLDGYEYGQERGLDNNSNPAYACFMAELEILVSEHGCKDFLSDLPTASVVAEMQELDAAPDPMIVKTRRSPGSRVELISVPVPYSIRINHCTGSVLRRIGPRDSDRIAVLLDGSGQREVSVLRSNLMITDHLPFPRTLVPKSTVCSPYVAGHRHYDIEDWIEQSRRQAEEATAEANAPVMESLRNSAEAPSVAEKSLTIVIFEYQYSQPSQWLNEALRELGSRKYFAGANYVLKPESFETVVEDMLRVWTATLLPDTRRPDLHYELGTSRFVITEAHRQHSVVQKIETLPIVIMEYSQPSEWFDEALKKMGSRKHFAGANCVLAQELFDTVVEALRSREEELSGLGVNLEKLRSRFVITEAHRQRSVIQKIETAKSANEATGMNRKKRGNCMWKNPFKCPQLNVHIPCLSRIPSAAFSHSSSSHQQDAQAGCIGSWSSSSLSHQQSPQAGCPGQGESWAAGQAKSWVVKRTFIEVPLPNSMRSS